MPLSKEEIKVAAMELNPVEREALAEELLLSINGEERQSMEAEWLAEARRRDADFTAGKMSASSVDAVVGRIQQRTRP